MNPIKNIFALAVVLLVSGCGSQSASTVDALNRAQAVGSPFTKYLTAQYRSFANYTQHNTMEFADALHFGRKGLASASGVIVMPETLDDWDLDRASLVEMAQARNDLVDALENGGRETAPEKAAIAQTRFDCWAEQQEKLWSKTVPCKSQFYTALKALQDTVGITAPLPATEAFPAPVTEMPQGPETSIQQATFVTFFDWNKYQLSNSANEVLDAVAQEIKSRRDVKGIVIVGHTDTSGSAKYNKKLSMRRAKSIHDALVARGINVDMIRVEGRGEEDLLVKTPDNIREPANRRGQITLE